jgi:Gas vesicle synthesis protein GvpL/GvpF
VKGREEWVLRIGTPDPRRATAAGQPSRAGADAPSGTAFLRAKADARRLARERTKRAAADAMRVFETLRKVADQATTRPVEPGLNVLLDAALLVKRRNVPALRRLLARAAAGLLEEGCPVSLTGPWPAYSFAALRDGHG